MSNIGSKQIMAENLNYYIESRNLDKREIAHEIGVRQSTFYSWCNGSAYPRIDKIEKLANYLNIDKMDLIEKHDQKYTDKKTLESLSEDSDKRMLMYTISTMDSEQISKLKKMIELLN